MYSDVINLVQTVSERDSLSRVIGSLRASLFEKEGKFEEILESQLPGSVADIIRVKAKKGEKPEDYLEGLLKALDSLPEVHLTLASEPSRKTMEAIFVWVSKNIGAGVLAVESKPSILGGALVSFAGKYYDGSLEKILTETLIADRQALVELVYPSKEASKKDERL
jgi:F0F1-type ATP synthase delta subunit